MGKWWERFTEEWNKSDTKDAKPRTYHWLILLACIGAGLMIVSQFISVREEVIPPREPPSQAKEATAAVEQTDSSSIHAYEEKLAQDLSELLEKVVGLEQVSVQVNLQSTEILVLEKNVSHKEQVTEETDQRGGVRKVTESNEERHVVTIQGKQGEEPIVIQRLKPNVNGIIIVAKGVENLETKSAILKAIRAYLDIPQHKIAILPKG